MPLNKKGEKIMDAMTEQYGKKRGKQVFYASLNKGKIGGVKKMSNGGDVKLKTPVKDLPNPGLKALAGTEKGKKAVAKMGFRNGGIAKGGKCPHRGKVRGTGAAIGGAKFVGTR